MRKTVKFTISMAATDFKELESRRRQTGRTRSQFIRDAVRASMPVASPAAGIEEEAGSYKAGISLDVTNLEERRRRALAASGRFRSGLSDLSADHDRYLEDAYSAAPPPKEEPPAGKPR
jgi:hypothetical protein